MRFLEGIFATNEVTRDGRQITVSALASMLEQIWLEGTPSHFGHDLLRPAGWSNAHAVLLEPQLAQIAGQSRIPENDEEYARIIAACHQAEIEKRARAVEPFKKQLSDAVKGHTKGQGKFHFPGCPAHVEDGIAVSLCPKVFRSADEAGLIRLSSLEPVAAGVFRVGELALFAHHYFRRSCSRANTLCDTFLDYLIELANSGLDIRIRLDQDMIGLVGEFLPHAEFQYQRGPIFDDDLRDIDRGVTVHANSETSKHLTNIDRTEFRFGDQSGKRTFECEELVDSPTPFEDVAIHCCRYAHMTLGQDGVPDHADGAVRFYDPSVIEERRRADLKSAPHATKYEKLWRVYGSIKVAQWKTCLIHYFRDNRLIEEYFEGRENVRKDGATTHVDSRESDTGPFFPQVDEFLRAAISYHVNDEFPGDGISIHALDRVDGREGPMTIIEQDCLEIVKSLKIAGHFVALPKYFHYVAIEDAVVNFPLIIHRGQFPKTQFAATLQAFSEYLRARTLRRGDTYLSLNLGFAYDDRIAVLSVVGLASRLLRLLGQPHVVFPDHSSSLNEWIDSFYETSFANEPRSNDELYTCQYLQPSGLLRITREFIDPKLFKIVHDEKKNDVWIEFLNEPRAQSQMNWLRSETSTAAIALDVIKANCSRCGTDYQQCQCRRFIDRGVYQRIEKLDILGVVRTPIVRRAA